MSIVSFSADTEPIVAVAWSRLHTGSWQVLQYIVMVNGKLLKLRQTSMHRGYVQQKMSGNLWLDPRSNVQNDELNVIGAWPC